jgi:hypothetical protein
LAEARGSGDTMLGYDGLLITLTPGSKDFKTSSLIN